MLYRSLVLVSCSVSLLVACGVGELAPEPIILDEATAARVTVRPDGLSIAADSAGELAALRVGDLVISQAPEPFLRRVVAIEEGLSELSIATEPGSLEDAIYDGHL